MRPASIAPQPWDQFSVNYTDRVFSPLQFAPVRRRIVNAAKPSCVLDMGCGPTPLLLRELLRMPGIDLFASDLSQAMLDEVKRQFPANVIQFVHGDNRRLPFPDAFFDTVISVNSILPETRGEVDLMFGQVVRVLKPDGRFVAMLPAFETSLMARDEWHMEIKIDPVKHREFDTTGWQCFYTEDDVSKLASRHRFASYNLEPFYFDSEDAIKEIRKIYGWSISSQVLRDYPLFEHFLVADKTHSTSR